jgi:hypothetical protein
VPGPWREARRLGWGVGDVQCPGGAGDWLSGFDLPPAGFRRRPALGGGLRRLGLAGAGWRRVAALGGGLRRRVLARVVAGGLARGALVVAVRRVGAQAEA